VEGDKHDTLNLPAIMARYEPYSWPTSTAEAVSSPLMIPELKQRIDEVCADIRHAEQRVIITARAARPLQEAADVAARACARIGEVNRTVKINKARASTLQRRAAKAQEKLAPYVLLTAQAVEDHIHAKKALQRLVSVLQTQHSSVTSQAADAPCTKDQ
jgi:hypothetical protein